MKFKTVISILLLSFSAYLSMPLLAQKCDPAACAAKTSMTEVQTTTSAVIPAADRAAAPTSSALKTVDFTFPAGKVVEVALFSITPGKESIVAEDYFPKIFPVAMEYGLQGAQTFQVVDTKFGTAPAQVVGFFIWDSYEQKEAFNQDIRYLELRNIRNSAMDFLYLGYFQVGEDVNITLDNESYYDFAALWIDQANAPKLEEYFGHVAPVAMQPEFGYQPIATLNPLNTCTHGKYTPSMVGFAKWGGKDSFDRLMQNKTYKRYVHLRDEATPYKDVFLLQAIIE
ncbi:MAG: hypothetical protein AAFP77_11620 [Bacteroidota bacterium]